MLTCDDVRDSYSALLDNEVDPEYREVLDAHLAQCSECLRTLAKFKSVSDLYRELPAPETDYDFEAAVTQRLDRPAAANRKNPSRLAATLVGAIVLVATVTAVAWYLS